MKTTLIILFFLVLSGTIFAQCPIAGRDSTTSYCKQEVFDLANLRSSDADLNGIFIDPAGDTMSSTTTSLIFPGQYTYRYIVSDLGCSDDSAKYVIVIINCWPGGISETSLENNELLQINPVNDYLQLSEVNYDRLEIYSTAGSCVLTFSASPNTLIDVSKLEGGNYILILDKDGTRQFQRFVKL
ncbi:MAG: hypothetical protein K0S23_1991 [Fluviicola sp.]|jgi:hypothetical protein|uniref:T9SS type A sorting domain-containing protein n=1 Tax=Fluviicola sp. TaxID=1917219 RepID=UPI00262FE4DC|nr:T9SS type A sorting domain-containing protein [Fluviicola sp.]MDF3027684.1 hypothetical protein [Fluviicola sp.]